MSSRDVSRGAILCTGLPFMKLAEISQELRFRSMYLVALNRPKNTDRNVSANYISTPKMLSLIHISEPTRPY